MRAVTRRLALRGVLAGVGAALVRTGLAQAAPQAGEPRVVELTARRASASTRSDRLRVRQLLR
jgi:hypothetical protein